MDEQQLDSLMKLHTAKLFRIAYYYSRNLHTAEDIVQDVFIKFYEKNVVFDINSVERYLMKLMVWVLPIVKKLKNKICSIFEHYAIIMKYH